MNKLLILILSLTLSSLSFAESFSAKKQVLNCGMKILENQKMNQAIATELVDIFKKLTSNSAEELLIQCNALRKKARKAPYVETEGLQRFFEYNLQMEHREQAIRRALHLFSFGLYECKIHGVEVGAAVLLHVGVGVNVGRCQSYTGRRYLIVAPEFSAGGGLGVYVLFESSEFTLTQGELFHDEDKLGLVAGLGYVESRPLRGESGTRGGGVGAGASLKMSTTLNFKLLPLGRDYQFILDELSESKLD